MCALRTPLERLRAQQPPNLCQGRPLFCLPQKLLAPRLLDRDPAAQRPCSCEAPVPELALLQLELLDEGAEGETFLLLTQALHLLHRYAPAHLAGDDLPDRLGVAVDRGIACEGGQPLGQVRGCHLGSELGGDHARQAYAATELHHTAAHAEHRATQVQHHVDDHEGRNPLGGGWHLLHPQLAVLASGRNPHEEGWRWEVLTLFGLGQL
mmetsp:Transcript_134450/g.287650  ORF Transcript_134450/g.287650 Transcript_134450/m.287650 type:complete len:209 (-) Transcript_134450:95-721(-)